MNISVNLLNQLNQRSQKRSGSPAVDFQDVLEELDEDLSTEKIERNIELHFSRNQLDQKFQENLKRFLSELAYRYSKRFIELLKESSETLLTEEIIGYILEHGLDYPRIDVYYGYESIDKFEQYKENYRRYKIVQQAEEIRKSKKFGSNVPAELEDNYLDEEHDFVAWPRVEDNHVLVVFNLAAPLAYFWKKYSFGKPGVQGSFIEWGNFYNKLQREVVYQMKDEAGDFGIYINRLNQIGVHLHDQFYYLWDMYPKDS